MALWRFGRGWNEAEMRDYLAALKDRPVNFDDPPETMTVDHGWTVDGRPRSLGHRAPGPPRARRPLRPRPPGDRQLRLLRPLRSSSAITTPTPRSSAATCCWS